MLRQTPATRGTHTDSLVPGRSMLILFVASILSLLPAIAAGVTTWGVLSVLLATRIPLAMVATMTTGLSVYLMLLINISGRLNRAVS